MKWIALVLGLVLPASAFGTTYSYTSQPLPPNFDNMQLNFYTLDGQGVSDVFLFGRVVSSKVLVDPDLRSLDIAIDLSTSGGPASDYLNSGATWVLKVSGFRPDEGRDVFSFNSQTGELDTVTPDAIIDQFELQFHDPDKHTFTLDSHVDEQSLFRIEAESGPLGFSAQFFPDPRTGNFFEGHLSGALTFDGPVQDPAQVPEPATMAMLGMGILAMYRKART